VICQLDVVHKWPSKLPHKFLDENCFCFPGRFTVIQTPQNGALGVSVLNDIRHLAVYCSVHQVMGPGCYNNIKTSVQLCSLVSL
jgi:hypothetical protein